jgi:hypothetical protein
MYKKCAKNYKTYVFKEKQQKHKSIYEPVPKNQKTLLKIKTDRINKNT